MMATDQWRALTTEMPIDPDLPIIDAHHHIWPVPPVPGYEAYVIEDLIADKTGSGHNIVATVCVDSHANWRKTGPEPLRPVGETEFVDAIAADCIRRGPPAAGGCGAIVPHADLMLGARVEEVLRAHQVASPLRLRGIRHMTVSDPDYKVDLGTFPHMMATRAFREGFACLETLGLSFDGWVLHPQLPEMTELARAFPGTRIILNHIGGPIGVGRYAEKRHESFAEWRTSLAELATCPNVRVKLGGLHTPMMGLTGERGRKPRGSEAIAAAHRDYQLTAIDLFGPARCMFESNFPVDRIWSSATIIWNAFKRAVADFSASERSSMFHDVAFETYRPATGPSRRASSDSE